MESRLQLPELLSCSLDLATGTGKSYVLYGIAAILLAEGAVDQVLTLCPSNTIEHGLTGKFRALASDPDLRESIAPRTPGITRPEIINASQSITGGCICVENYHAILKHVKSSIRESLRDKGKRTLVMNDEAHHVHDEDLAWSRALLKIHRELSKGLALWLDYSATPKDQRGMFFPWTICDYPLAQAVEDRIVKAPIMWTGRTTPAGPRRIPSTLRRRM